MLFRHPSKPPRTFAVGGFTLIELAIVMGVIGVVTAGLWRLSAVSNAQNKDQAAAQQQLALMAAVKAYLVDTTPVTGGFAFLTFAATQAGNIANLPLPASCAGATSWDITLCTYLPSGFTSSTPNSYGQAYNIQVVAGVAPNVNQGYSFMIMTSGGSTIPDADGGRISNLIGGDGGFLYTSGSICAAGAAPAACGALGAWSVGSVVTAYGFTAAKATGGHVASQSFTASQSNLDGTWLARRFLGGDGTPPSNNTMVTDMYIGAASSTSGANIYLPGDKTITPSAVDIGYSKLDISSIFSTALPMSGAIHLGNSYIDGAGLASTFDYPTVSGGMAQINLKQQETISGGALPLIQLQGICSVTKAHTGITACLPVLNVLNGDIEVGGQTLGGQISSSSDRRFKTDIHTLTNSLDDVMEINPVSFTYKSNGKKGMGVIAQEMEKIYPQLVTNDYKGMKYVSYDGLIGPLIESVQELKHQNDDLRAQLAAQSARLDKLEGQRK